MDYPIEVRLASKNGYHTPAEARAYYGRYSRDGETWHWWGDGGANGHDATVNYILGRAGRGEGSVNYVLSNEKITLLVDPMNVAWASQSGNPTTVSVELQTYLGDEGYKKAGWLKWYLEKNYPVGGANYPHNFWFATQCPGTISLDRIQQEYLKWKSGGYNPAPTPTPTPPAQAELIWTRWKEGAIQYVANKAPTKLWNFNQTAWSGFGNGVKDFNKGDQIVIVGEVFNKTLNSKYLLTEYSFNNKITNGFNAADLDVYVPPRPVPTPPVDVPTVPPPYKPEWEANLRDIDNTKYWVAKDQDLIDIKTGLPTGTKTFKKDDEFEVSALTMVGGVEYRITEFSFKKGIFNGVPISSLTLTAPGIPDEPPVPDYPPLDDDTKNFLQLLLTKLGDIVKAITDFLSRRK